MRCQSSPKLSLLTYKTSESVTIILKNLLTCSWLEISLASAVWIYDTFLNEIKHELNEYVELSISFLCTLFPLNMFLKLPLFERYHLK